MGKASRGVMVVGNQTSVQAMFREYNYNIIYDSHRNAKPDLICFTGGSDIDPTWYNEPRIEETIHIHKNRDKLEIEYFQNFKYVPKVGICRGGQLLNVLAGGQLWQDVNNHGRNHETLDLLLTKDKLVVTSTHHQMMVPTDQAVPVAVAFEATEYKSGVPRKKPIYDPEVLWYEKDNSLCFQPHPEYGGEKNKECTEYFFDLLNYFYF